MRIGIIGLPGSGKSTLWRCLTGDLESPAAARAVKLQLRTVKVHDPRLERLRDDYRPRKYTPATLEIGDFPGVSTEERDRAGLAELLAPAREMDALIAVLRGFENPLHPPPGGRIDPIRDWGEIRSELLFSDLAITEKRIEKLEQQVKKRTATQERDRKELALLIRLRGHIEAERDLVDFPFAPEERKLTTGFSFLSAKPRVPVLNRGETPPAAELLAELERRAGRRVFVISVRNEIEILELPPEEREAFYGELGIVPGARDRLIAECYQAADFISYFTVSEKEVRAWTIRRGDPAVVAAEKIHSDMARGFIRAETVAFEDYVREGGHKGAREKGLLRLEGKEYPVQDGDIIEFRFNA